MPKTKSEKQIYAEMLKRVRGYSEETGIPVQTCLNEALEEWIVCCMETRLETLRSAPKPKIMLVPGAFLVKSAAG